jgi:hypothetical protein
MLSFVYMLFSRRQAPCLIILSAITSFYPCLLLYPFFVSKTENKKGSRDFGRGSGVFVSTNINTCKSSPPKNQEPLPQQLLAVDCFIL